MYQYFPESFLDSWAWRLPGLPCVRVSPSRSNERQGLKPSLCPRHMSCCTFSHRYEVWMVFQRWYYTYTLVDKSFLISSRTPWRLQSFSHVYTACLMLLLSMHEIEQCCCPRCCCCCSACMRSSDDAVPANAEPTTS